MNAIYYINKETGESQEYENMELDEAHKKMVEVLNDTGLV